jgi:hypothetical protein
MPNPVQEKLDAHLKWLETEIADCEKKGFEGHPNGKAYLETLKVSHNNFGRLKHTTTRP